jgi:hypothetical protein
MDRHVKILGLLNMLYGILGGTLAVAILVGNGGFGGLYSAFNDDSIGAFAVIFTGVQLVVSIPCIVCGYFVRSLQDWARMLLIVTSAINVLNIPIGTVLGAYGLWVLMTPESEPLFTNANRPKPKKPGKRRSARNQVADASEAADSKARTSSILPSTSD